MCKNHPARFWPMLLRRKDGGRTGCKSDRIRYVYWEPNQASTSQSQVDRAETMLHSSCCMWRHFVITQLRLREGDGVDGSRQRQTETSRQRDRHRHRETQREFLMGQIKTLSKLIFGIIDFSQTTKKTAKFTHAQICGCHRRRRTSHSHEVTSTMSVLVV